VGAELTLAEYRAWLDGMIAATGDERLKLAREKLAEVQEAAPFVAPLSPPPFVSPVTTPYVPNYWPTVTCGSVLGVGDPNVLCWNGRLT
jgi:hypothetical protein